MNVARVLQFYLFTEKHVFIGKLLKYVEALVPGSED